MIISEKTIKALQEVINGDGALGIYRSGPVLVDFFNGFGRNDEYGRGFPSRSQYTAECLSSFNDSDELKDIIESVVDPRDYISPEDISSSETSEEMQLREIVDYLNKFLEYDGYRLKKDETRNRYEVIRLDGGIVPNENLDTLSDEFINDQIKKARGKLAQDDYDGAITNVRSLVEAFQEEIIRRSGAEVPKHDGDLLKLYRKTKQVLNLDPSEQPSRHTEADIDGLQQHRVRLKRYEQQNGRPPFQNIQTFTASRETGDKRGIYVLRVSARQL